MLLHEIFNSKNWKTIQADQSKYVAKFYINDSEYKFVARFIDQGDWYIYFAKIEDDEEKYDLTRTGNEFKVFGIVLNILKSFINQYDPHTLRFDADPQKRFDLYMKVLPKVCPNTEWQYTSKNKRIILIKN